MDEIKVICKQMQRLDQNGTWYDIADKWTESSDIERSSDLNYISSVCEEWLQDGVTERDRHIINNILEMITDLL